jgi:hypothetical protein
LSGVALPGHSKQVSGKKQMFGIFPSQIVNATRSNLETLESEYLSNNSGILFNEI